jgi:NADH-quinone oxidoreductase subunit M
LAPLLVLIVFLGVYPKPVLDRMAPSVDALVQHVEDNSDFVSPEVDRPVTASPADSASVGPDGSNVGGSDSAGSAGSNGEEGQP